MLSDRSLLEASGATGDDQLMAACRYVLEGGGKQLRPRLVLAASAVSGEEPSPEALRAAVAIELFHSASLAHDDVVDDGHIRRGRRSAGAAHGITLSVLSGGWLFARAADLVASCGDAAFQAFTRTACQVCEGQMLEVRDLYNVDRSTERYLATIEGKTASLFALSTWLGGMLSGLDSSTADRLRRFGDRLGMAFQIADDVLDLTGSLATTGKTRGKDLLQGVFTLPAIYAMERDSDLRRHLQERVVRSQLPSLVSAISATGVDAAIVTCREYLGEAEAEIEGLEGTGPLLQLCDDAVSNRLEEVACASGATP
jgi:heptaprenyl diphosphate synthase